MVKPKEVADILLKNFPHILDQTKDVLDAKDENKLKQAEAKLKYEITDKFVLDNCSKQPNLTKVVDYLKRNYNSLAEKYQSESVYTSN